MNSQNSNWSVPIWITSRSYFMGTEKARTIITNSKWWMHLVLTELSSDLWSVLPKRFSLESLRQPLETIGIDLNDDEHWQEVESFLHTLWQDGVLVIDSGTNPAPNRTVSDYQEESKHISSVAAMFNDGLADEGILASVFFELTYRCNQCCVHCFNPRSTFDHSKELSTDEVITILAELEVMGVYCVTFSGGEVSLRPDFFDIMREAQSRNFAVSVFTNGQVSPNWIEELVTFFPQTVGVSLYSANPEIHDATTHRKGSFNESVRTIETLVKHGVRTTVKCPLMNHTVHGYKELLTLCDRLGGIPQFDFHISPATDGDQSCTEHQVLDPDILALMFREPRTSLYVDLTLPNHGRVRRAMNDAVCGGGHTSLSICPDGTVYPCNSFPIPLGNIRNDGIRKVWESSEELVAWKKTVWNDFNECGLYADCAYCSFCPGMSLLETGNLFGKAKTCCTTAKVRRTVALDLRNGKDPLVDYVNHTQPFGMDTTFQLPKKSFKGVMRQFCAQSKITKNHLENLQQLAATAGVDLVDFDKVYQGCEDAVSQSQFISQESGVIEQVPFLQRYMEIQQHGNNVRKTIVPESDSPVEENLTKEMLVGSARFFESGR